MKLVSTYSRLDPLRARVTQEAVLPLANLFMFPLLLAALAAYAYVLFQGYFQEPYTFRTEQRLISRETSAYEPMLTPEALAEAGRVDMELWLAVPGAANGKKRARAALAAATVRWSDCKEKNCPSALGYSGDKCKSVALPAVSANLRNIPGTRLNLANEIFQEAYLASVGREDANASARHRLGDDGFIWARWGSDAYGGDVDSLYRSPNGFETKLLFRDRKSTDSTPWEIFVTPGTVAAAYITLDLMVDEKGNLLQREVRHTRFELLREIKRNFEPETGRGCEPVTDLLRTGDLCDFRLDSSTERQTGRPTLSQLGCNFDSLVFIRFEDTSSVVVRADRLFDVIGQVGGGWSLIYTVFRVLAGILQVVLRKCCKEPPGKNRSSAVGKEDHTKTLELREGLCERGNPMRLKNLRVFPPGDSPVATV